MNIFLRNIFFLVVGSVGVAFVNVAHSAIGKKEHPNTTKPTICLKSERIYAEGIDVLKIQNETMNGTMFINVFETKSPFITVETTHPVKNNLAIEISELQDSEIVIKENMAEVKKSNVFRPNINVYIPKSTKLFLNGFEVNVTLHNVSKNHITTLCAAKYTIKNDKITIRESPNDDNGPYIIDFLGSGEIEKTFETRMEKNIKKFVKILEDIDFSYIGFKALKIKATTMEAKHHRKNLENVEKLFQEDIKKIAERYEKILEKQLPLTNNPMIEFNKALFLTESMYVNSYMSDDKESSFLTAPMEKFCRKVANITLEKEILEDQEKRHFLLQMEKEVRRELMSAFQKYVDKTLTLALDCFSDNLKKESEAMLQKMMIGEEADLLKRDEEELFQKLMMGERIGLLQRDENGKYRPHPTNQKDGKRYLNDILKKHSKLKDDFLKWVKMAEDKQPEKKTTVKPMQEEEKKDGGKGGKRCWYD